MTYDKYLGKLVDLNEEMKEAFGENTLSESIPKAIRTNTEFVDTFSRTVVNFYNDNVKDLGNRIFYNAKDLETSVTPNAEKVGIYAFYGCPLLRYIDLGDKVNFIAERAFFQPDYDNSLTAVVIRNTDEVCVLDNTNVFKYTMISQRKGKVYVPDELYEDYLVANNWSSFTAVIGKISELEGGNSDD